MTEHTTKLDAVGTNGCKVTTETLHAQPAAPPAPTMYECHKHGVVVGDHCPQCRVVAYVDVSNAPDTRHAEAQEPNRFIPDMAHCARCKKADNLHSPDGICPPQEPKAQEWIRRAAEEAVVKIEGYDKAITAFPETGRELVIRLLCEIIAAHAPDVTALSRVEQVRDEWCDEYTKLRDSVTALVESAERAANKIELYHQTRTGFADDLDDVKAIRTAIAAVKKGCK